MENSNTTTNDSSKMTKIELSGNNNSRVIIIILIILLILSLLGVNTFLFFGNILDKFFSGLKYYFIQLLTSLGFYSGAVINTTADIVGDASKTGIDIAEGTVQSVGNLLQNRPNMGGTTLEQQQWNMNVFDMNSTPIGASNDSGEEVQYLQNQITELNTKIDNTQNQKNNKVENITDKVNEFASKINDKKDLLVQLDSEINERQNSLQKMGSDYQSNISWCPVGTEKNNSVCMQVNKNDKCMYGKTFESKELCEQEISKDFLNKSSNYRQNFPNWGTSMMKPPSGALAPPNRCNTPQLPGMCLQQKPMCGGGMKQMPLQSIPSRGQIQQGMPLLSQQQMNQQMNQPQMNQPQMNQPQMNQPQMNTPDQSQTNTPDQSQTNTPDQSQTNTPDQYNPDMGKISYNSFSPSPQYVSPSENDGLIIGSAPSPDPLENKSSKSSEIKISIPDKALNKLGNFLDNSSENIGEILESPAVEKLMKEKTTQQVSSSPATLSSSPATISSSPATFGPQLNSSIVNLTDAINENTESRVNKSDSSQDSNMMTSEPNMLDMSSGASM